MARRRPVWDRPPARFASSWRWVRTHVLTAATIGVVGGLVGVASTIYTLVLSRRITLTVAADALYFPAEYNGETFLGVTVINDSQRQTNLIGAQLRMDGQLISVTDGLADERRGIRSDADLFKTVGRTPVQIPADGSVRVAVLLALSGPRGEQLTREILVAKRHTPPVAPSPCGSALAEQRDYNRLQHFGYYGAASSTARLFRGHRLLLRLLFDPGGWRTVQVQAASAPDSSIPQATSDSLAGWRAVLDVLGATPQGLAVTHTPPEPRTVTVSLYARRSAFTITRTVAAGTSCVTFGRLARGTYEWAVTSGAQTVSVGRFRVPCANASPLGLGRWLVPDDPAMGMNCLQPAG